jgi:hypothetical protein
VLADTAFFLGFTAAMNVVAARDADSGDLTDFGHDRKVRLKLRGFAKYFNAGASQPRMAVFSWPRETQ